MTITPMLTIEEYLLHPTEPECEYIDGVLFQEAPLLCIEILSPSDRLPQTVLKCEEYLRWGVPSCWILDPKQRLAWVTSGDGLNQVPSDGTLEAGPFSLPLHHVLPNV